ncbi:DUF4158 domain-containing protein [Leptolyngbya subtilissima ST-M1]|nr:DUF4158 domain-containing protein [Nodosilinea sp. FACHB-131]
MGFAIQLWTVRFLGTFLVDPLEVPPTVVAHIAPQLGISDWVVYRAIWIALALIGIMLIKFNSITIILLSMSSRFTGNVFVGCMDVPGLVMKAPAYSLMSPRSG